MQTHLRGRDMITTQEWTKDELDTVIDVAVDQGLHKVTFELVDRRENAAVLAAKGMGFAEFSGRVAFVRMIEQAERGERGIRT